MLIENAFTVAKPLDQVWDYLLDVHKVAPCMPGAQLQEVEGDEYRGIVKVKVGPITAQYKGTATLAEVDEPGRRIVIDASGRDTRGQGNAKASIVVTMLEEGDGTRVEVVTDLAITGKVAQFGRGVLVDVSSKLMGQFVENLERDVLATQDSPPEAPPAAEAPAAPAAENVAARAAEGARPPTELRRIDSKEAEPIDLLEMAGGSQAARLIPIAIGAVVLFLLWRLLRSRS